MSSFTYAQMVAALQSWQDNDNAEFVANIPRLISLGETRLLRDMNLELLDITDTTLLVEDGDTVVGKPDGLIETRFLFVVVNGERIPLERRSQAFCQTYAPDDTVTGQPKYFYDLDEQQWGVAPAADDDYNIEGKLVIRPDGLSESTTVTWLSTNLGDLLFACCLMEAEHYIKADDRYNDMKTKYYEELLPTARLEMRNSIRNGDYTPVKAAAKTVE